MGTWIEGCVPDSRRYVPGRKLAQVSAEHPAGAVVAGATIGHVPVAGVTPATTSVPNDRTRGPCTGGVPCAPVLAMNQVVFACAAEWSGAAEQVEPPVQPVPTVPRPPPTWPTIMIDVGILFAGGAVPPVGVGGWNERLLVRLIVRLV